MADPGSLLGPKEQLFNSWGFPGIQQKLGWHYFFEKFWIRHCNLNVKTAAKINEYLQCLLFWFCDIVVNFLRVPYFLFSKSIK